MITFVYKEEGCGAHCLKIGYDKLRTFVVYDHEGYNNIFTLTMKHKCLMKISDKRGNIISKTLTVSQMKWLSKYMDIVKEAERENYNPDA